MENSAWVEESDSSFDFKYYAKRYLRLWPLLLCSLILCLGYTYYYLRFEATPVYRSTTKVLLSPENYSAGLSNAINLSIWGEGQKNVSNEIAIFRTSFLMEQLVKKRQLNVFWYQVGRFKEIEIFDPPMKIEVDRPIDSMRSISFHIVPLSRNEFEIRYKDGDEEIMEKKVFGQFFTIEGGDNYKLTNNLNSQLYGQYKVTINSIESAARRYNSSLTVGMDNKDGSIVNLSFTYPIATKAAYILNHYVKEFTFQNDLDKTRIADSTIKFIDSRILMVNEELTQLESNIQHYMQEKGLANLETQSGMLLSDQNTYNQQLTALENRLSLIKELKSSLDDVEARRIVPGSLLEEDAGFSNLSSNYNDLLLQRERMLLSYKPENPYIQNIDKQIEEVRLNILEYLNNTENRLFINRKGLQNTINKVTGNIRQVPKEQREVLDLERRQQLAQNLYLFLLQRREETAVANSARGAGIRVIEPAKGGVDMSTNPMNYWMMAFVIALLVPVGKIVAEELLNSKVRSRKDITKRTTAPIIAEISHKDEDYTLIDFVGKRSALAEQFRSLRTDLQFMLNREGAKVVMLTSGMPGEGKSFTALNLAHVLAYAGKKVLLMEFDLRRPKLSIHFKQRDMQLGITNYIVDRSLDLAQLIYNVPGMEGLDYLGSGPVPPNPSELIANERTQQLMQEVRANYDIIVVDTPPIGLVTDAQLLNSYVDATLYMVRAQHSPLDLLKLIDELYQSGKIRNMALVFNDVKPEDGGYYGYYGYGYGYYGEEEVKKKGSWFKKK